MQNQSPKTKPFFSEVLGQFQSSGIPFLVGGGFAMRRHTGLTRPRRDLDLFVLPKDAHRALQHFSDLGYRVELTFPHWLGKIYRKRAYVDVIFSSGNGLVAVDDGWFEHSIEATVLGTSVRICPAEEMIWSKSFVMERERYDGADIHHLLSACSKDLDWKRLLDRFQSNRLVLLSHLVLFVFVYPNESTIVPSFVWNDLLAWLDGERRHPSEAGRVCRGPLLSRSQYLDALQRGYRDPRLRPEGNMRPQDVAIWTDAAKKELEQPDEP
jgi:hypothetical protein